MEEYIRACENAFADPISESTIRQDLERCAALDRLSEISGPLTNELGKTKQKYYGWFDTMENNLNEYLRAFPNNQKLIECKNQVDKLRNLVKNFVY
jgi:hypothetical protein